MIVAVDSCVLSFGCSIRKVQEGHDKDIDSGGGVIVAYLGTVAGE